MFLLSAVWHYLTVSQSTSFSKHIFFEGGGGGGLGGIPAERNTDVFSFIKAVDAWSLGELCEAPCWLKHGSKQAHRSEVRSVYHGEDPQRSTTA